MSRPQVFVKLFDGTVMKINFTDATTVGELTAEIGKRQDKIKAENLRLVFWGRAMDNPNETLVNLGIGNGSTVSPIYRVPGGW
jgi:hypothetical protein